MSSDLLPTVFLSGRQSVLTALKHVYMFISSAPMSHRFKQCQKSEVTIQ